eukprot:CFRG6637T1
MIFFLVFSVILVLYPTNAQTLTDGREPIWSDEFDGVSIDNTKWKYDILPAYRYNNELQSYTSSSANSFIKDGKLHIRAIPTGTNSYTSARMVTTGMGKWTYGTLKIRASLPLGEGLWPAIWMLPSASSYSWPTGGEIDIMEHVTCDPNVLYATVHTGAYNWPMGTQVGKNTRMADVRDFHEYTLDWTNDEIKVSVDEELFFVFKNDGTGNDDTWPFSDDFHLIMNVAVGGNWGGYCLNGRKPSFPTSGEESTMTIDYVRVYAPPSSTSPLPATPLPTTPLPTLPPSEVPCDQPQLDSSCESRILWMLENWNKVDWADKYVEYGVDGSRCSIQHYLYSVEGYCSDPVGYSPVTPVSCDQPQSDSSCENRILWMLENWNKVDWADKYVKYGVDGSRCSIQHYLYSVEGYCSDPVGYSPVTPVSCDQPQSDSSCENRILWMLENWNKVDWTDKYVEHGVDGSRCSIQHYLYSVEEYCSEPVGYSP